MKLFTHKNKHSFSLPERNGDFIIVTAITVIVVTLADFAQYAE
jgi:hypothetical protein